MISVEHALSTRFPALPQHSPKLFRTMVRVLRFVCKESEFHHFAQRYPDVRGLDFANQVLEYFDFDVAVNDDARERIPAWGRLVIIANHPIGSLDALALLKVVGQVRPDVKVVATEILTLLKPLEDLLLPVDNFSGSTPRENLRAIERHLENEGALIIFPSGEVSRMGPRGVRDGRWQQGFLRFASKTRAPILPVFVDAHNSLLFYSMSFVSKTLSMLWLVREMFKHRHNEVRLHIGQGIGFDVYDPLPLQGKARIRLFKRHLYKIAKNRGDACFRNAMQPVAPAEDRQALRQEILACEPLATTREGLQIVLLRNAQDGALLREIGRLREISFRAVGEGTGKNRDVDDWDHTYDHIVLWDDAALDIVGAYRLRCTSEEDAAPAPAPSTPAAATPLYSQNLFDWLPASRTWLREGAELGRSFVQPRYWRQNGLDLLWRGIGAYLQKHPHVRYLFGPVSISNRFPARAQALLIGFYRHYFHSPIPWAQARTPYLADACVQETSAWQHLPYTEGLQRLKKELAAMRCSIPPLYKQYSELCEEGGAHFADFNIDRDFCGCVDGLVLVELDKLKPRKRRRYLQREG